MANVAIQQTASLSGIASISLLHPIVYFLESRSVTKSPVAISPARCGQKKGRTEKEREREKSGREKINGSHGAGVDSLPCSYFSAVHFSVSFFFCRPSCCADSTKRLFRLLAHTLKNSSCVALLDVVEKSSIGQNATTTSRSASFVTVGVHPTNTAWNRG